MNPAPRRFGAVALLLSLLGGCSALIHQMVWIRRLVDTLGATADTFAAVTGAFFLGLAIGGWASTRATAHSPAGWWARVALAEVGIGVLALGVLFSSRLAPWLAASPLPDGALRLLLPALLIGPPALAMGLVTPWLIRATLHGARPLAVPLYTLNTVGGLIGIVVALARLLPALGTLRTGLVAVALNFLVALVAWWISRRPAAPAPEKSADPAPSPVRSTSGATVAFGSGFLVLATEVVLQLQFTQVTVNSHFSGGFVLLLVLTGLSLGAAFSGSWQRLLGGNPSRALTTALLAALLACAVQSLLFQWAFHGLTYQPYQVGTARYFRQILGPGLLCVVLPLSFAGLVFPLLLRELQHQAPAAIGRALAWNGLGGWLGAEAAQGFLLPRLGLWGAMGAVGAGYSVLLLALGGSWKKKTLALGGLATSAAAWVFFSGLPQVQPTHGDHLRAIGVGREGVVAVTEGAKDDWRIIFNNSYTLGGSLAASNQERQAHLPILLHGHAQTVATLGLATGSTASGALCHAAVQRLDTIELSPLVMKYAGRYFAPYNRNLLADPRVRPIHADARWEILRQPASYDVVLGDLFLPWRTGEGRLYSREHFAAVQRSLKPGGLYCQWLPMYQLTAGQFAAIARTFRTVFPEAFVVRGDFYVDKPIVGLIGGRPLSAIDWEAVRRGCDDLRAVGGIADPLARHAEGVAMMVAGPLPALPDGPVITLDNAWLEWDAGRNIITGGQSWLVGVPGAQFLREAQRLGKPLLPPALAVAHEGGQFFLTLGVAHGTGARERELAARIPEFLPASLRQDPQADWSRWPGLPKPR